eukprot:TRINITY_DN24169_c0_g1_i2.p1 TRINITY_DN24169_c0_g1~~TRINITY_DN24169_c0_g1_i2.p1  ORF type:complete len:450 (+),score=56.10 TRINITY_DN24169_c0_g1_i2:41-1390(+)
MGCGVSSARRVKPVQEDIDDAKPCDVVEEKIAALSAQKPSSNGVEGTPSLTQSCSQEAPLVAADQKSTNHPQSVSTSWHHVDAGAWMNDTLWQDDSGWAAAQHYLRFTLDVATPPAGSAVRVVGSLPELGSWDHCHGVELVRCHAHGSGERWESLCTVVCVQDSMFGSVEAQPRVWKSELADCLNEQWSSRPLMEGLEQPYQVATKDILMTYLVSLPRGSLGGDKMSCEWPLLMYLHGYFGRNERAAIMPGLWEKGRRQTPLAGAVDLGEFVVLSPQAPAGYYWLRRDCSTGTGLEDFTFEREEYCPSIAFALSSLLELIVSKAHVDRQRMYLCGTSMGGYGCLEYARLFPQRFAALALGAPHYAWLSAPHRVPALVSALSQARVWIFHGEDDEICSFEESRSLAQMLVAAGAKVQLTSKGVEGHDAWSKMFCSDSNIVGWFLRHEVDA